MLKCVDFKYKIKLVELFLLYFDLEMCLDGIWGLNFYDIFLDLILY